jgi:hypothetical protein
VRNNTSTAENKTAQRPGQHSWQWRRTFIVTQIGLSEHKVTSVKPAHHTTETAGAFHTHTHKHTHARTHTFIHTHIRTYIHKYTERDASKKATKGTQKTRPHLPESSWQKGHCQLPVIVSPDQVIPLQDHAIPLHKRVHRTKHTGVLGAHAHKHFTHKQTQSKPYQCLTLPVGSSFPLTHQPAQSSILL